MNNAQEGRSKPQYLSSLETCDPKIEMILTHHSLAPVLRPRLLVRTAEGGEEREQR